VRRWKMAISPIDARKANATAKIGADKIERVADEELRRRFLGGRIEIDLSALPESKSPEVRGIVAAMYRGSGWDSATWYARSPDHYLLILNDGTDARKAEREREMRDQYDH
jgi:hypothetical protein